MVSAELIHVVCDIGVVDMTLRDGYDIGGPLALMIALFEDGVILHNNRLGNHLNLKRHRSLVSCCITYQWAMIAHSMFWTYHMIIV